MTNDLAIKILTGDVLGTTEQTHEAVAIAVKALSALPSAQPDVTDTNVGDMISRQAAIDMVRSYYDECDEREESIEERIEQLPSADAVKVVRCKDCKHWIPYDWMFSEVWKSQNIDDYTESEIGCTYCDMSMGAVDYCSRGERKDG